VLVWLALDSSTAFLSLALLERTRGVWHAAHEVVHGPLQKQSEILPRSLDALLKQAGLTPVGLEGVLVGLGPGSFTGLRVGLASAKGLAYAAHLPIAGASSLGAVAVQVLEVPEEAERRPPALILPLTVSRRGEVYAGAYRRQGTGVISAGPEEALSVAQVAAWLLAHPDASAVGPAVAEHRAALEALGVPPRALHDGPAHPSARALAALIDPPVGFDFSRLAALEPHYVGTSGAERHAKG
jgi:tRNA threonylcarbamoyladenosine biosynthesis protein TsaB